ncbi:hybrid signal transduction histidine kinase M [Tanacetum coccineum]
MEGFENFVKEVWCEAPVDNSNAMINMMNKLKYLKKKIRAWNGMRQSPKTQKHVLKQELVDLEMIIDKGDASSDTLHKRAEVVKSIQEVDKLCAMEASQKAKIKWAIEGDENSKYYHGLSINLSKSKLLGVVVSEDRVVQAANRIGCGVLKAPFAYLGSKVRGNMSRIKSWDEIVDKMVDRLSKWKMKTLSIGGRLTLLKAVLGSMPIYHMSIFKVPMKVLQRMESIRSRFFSGVDLNSKKSIWVKWSKVLCSKEKGGLGVLENLTWSFRRAPRSRVEQDQLTDLTTYLEGVVLGVTPDRWYWTLDGSGEFSVASARKVIDDNRPSQPIPKTLNHQTSPRFNSRTHHSAMTNSNTPPPPPALTLVEKLYAVHNINSLVPEKLDLQESNYSTWSYFFKGHCSNFNVLNHIDGSTSTSDPPTDEWITADSIVKSWIFLTLSPTLRKRMISTNPASAKAAWDTIETIFQENKRTRTVALKGELRVIQMGDDTPDAYFSKIDSIITLLTDLGSTMDDDDIVTYAINGLSEKYGSLAQIIAHKDPFPDLATVRTMVTTEEMRLRSKQPILSTSTTSSSPQVLLATSQPRIQDNRNNRDRDARNENKTEICRNFGRGYCRWGTNCRFIHASPKGTNNPRPNSSQHNTRSMQQGPGHTGLNSASQQHLLSLIQAQQNLLAQYGLSI